MRSSTFINRFTLSLTRSLTLKTPVIPRLSSPSTSLLARSNIATSSRSPRTSKRRSLKIPKNLRRLIPPSLKARYAFISFLYFYLSRSKFLFDLFRTPGDARVTSSPRKLLIPTKKKWSSSRLLSTRLQWISTRTVEQASPFRLLPP